MNNKPDKPLSYHVGWATPTAMFIAGFYLLSVDPVESPGLKITGYGLFVAGVVWMYLRCRNSEDEVVRAANVAAMAVGGPIGLGLAFVSIFIVRFAPSATEFVSNVAARASQEIAPEIAGFGMGILFTCLVVTLSVAVAWITWWFAKR